MNPITSRFAVGALRVILDRSAFHEPGYTQLSDSRIKDLCRSGRMSVIHTPTFLSETLTAYGAGESAADWPNHLQFALDICNGGIFLPKEAIWHEELVAGRGPFARHLQPERPNKTYISRPILVSMLQDVARTGDLSREWADTEEIRIENRQKKKESEKDISRRQTRGCKNKAGARDYRALA